MVNYKDNYSVIIIIVNETSGTPVLLPLTLTLSLRGERGDKKIASIPAVIGNDFIDRRDACSTGINRFDESNPYRKFIK